ncbi:hypothetical protein [Burkholderia latens]|uniref:SpaN/EivJ family type III secretion system needle length determinant n=1 Tax=Burkholderia latens TaxID=488446 RepID=UPI00158BCE91|nr:hypothetical protein [Burkholderia latens]
MATPQPFVSVLASAFRTVRRWCVNREESQHIEQASAHSSGPQSEIHSDINDRGGSVHERADLRTEDELVRSNRRQHEQVELGADKNSRRIRMAGTSAISRGWRDYNEAPVAMNSSGREHEIKSGKLSDQPGVSHERLASDEGSASQGHHSGAVTPLDRTDVTRATHEHRQVGSLTESLADDTGHGLILRRHETKRRAEDEKTVVQPDCDQAFPHPVPLHSPEAFAAKTTSRAHEAMEHRFGESDVPDEAMVPMRPDSAPARTIRYQFKTWAGEPAVDIQTHGDRSKPEITVSTSDETVADALENRSNVFFAPIRRIRRDSDRDESPRRSPIYHTQDED